MAVYHVKVVARFLLGIILAGFAQGGSAALLKMAGVAALCSSERENRATAAGEGGARVQNESTN